MAEACAAFHHRRYGWAPPPGWITPLADVTAGLQAAIEHFTPAGAPVVLPTPAYMPFLQVPRLMGRELVEVPMLRGADGRPTHDLAALDRALVPGALLVHVDPHNPTGRVFTESEHLALAGVLAYLDGNRLLLADLLAEHLPRMRYTPPEGTYLAWLDGRGLGVDESLGGFFLREAGVAFVDGPECGAPGAGHVRLNLATPRPVLRTIVERMAAACP